MVGGRDAIQGSITLLEKRRSKQSFLAYGKLAIGITIKGIILSGVLLALVTLPWFTFFIPNMSIANYPIVGVLIEILITLGLFIKYRDINKIYRYYLSKDFPSARPKPEVIKLTIAIKGHLSNAINYIRKRLKWITAAIVTDLIVIAWDILNPPDPASMPYNIMAIIIGPLLILWILEVIERILKEKEQASTLKSYLNQEITDFIETLQSVLPSKKESLALIIVAFVLAMPLYFNKDIGMPGFVNNYDRAGFFERFESVYGSGNDSSKVVNIVNWSTTHFNDLYAGMFTLTFDTRIMGNLMPPTLTIRPDPRNTSLASKYVLIVQNGNCGESAMALMGLAQMADVPVRQVVFHGEDHSFTEMFVDDRWMTIDPLTRYNGNGYDVPPRYYEKNWGYKVSYAEAIYPNGSIGDVTDRYTDIGTIIVTVLDRSNHTVANATVSVNSLNRANAPTNLTKITGEDGIAELKLGDGLYQITASNNTLTGSTDNSVYLNASEVKRATITLKNKNTMNLVNEMAKNDLVYYVIMFLVAIIGTLATYLLLRFYNNRYLKMVVYGFYSIIFLFVIITLTKIFIIF